MAMCKGVMIGNNPTKCLLINGGKNLNKRETNAFNYNFEEVTIINQGPFENVWPKDEYHIIVVNWALNELSSKKASDLLNTLRKGLDQDLLRKPTPRYAEMVIFTCGTEALS